MNEMNDTDDCDSSKVLSEGPTVVYVINHPITFHSIGATIHRNTLNINLAISMP